MVSPTGKNYTWYSIIDHLFWDWDEDDSLVYEFESTTASARFTEELRVFDRATASLAEINGEEKDWPSSAWGAFKDLYWDFRIRSGIFNNNFWSQFEDRLLTPNQQRCVHSYKTFFDEEPPENELCKMLGNADKNIDNARTYDKHQALLNEIHELYEKKNHDYGDSFSKSIDIFGLTAAAVRMSDKWERFNSLMKKEALVSDEAMRDTLIDLANYAIMTVMYLDEKGAERVG